MPRLQITIDGQDAVRTLALLDKELIGFEKQVKSSEKAVAAFSNNSTALLKGLAGGFAGFLAVGKIIEFSKQLATISDEYTNIDAKIALVTSSSEEFEKIFDSIYQQGLATGTTMDVNAQAFSKLAFGMQDVARSDIVGYLETVNKSLSVSGAGAQEASAFMLQFGQAMGSGAVAGDELKSMIESNSYLMGKLADNLGTNIRGLKDMGAAGTLTRDVFVKALSEISGSVDKDFASIPLTIEKATNKLNEVWKRMFTDAEQVSEGSSTIAGSISDLADVIEDNREEISEVFSGMIDSIPGVVSGIKSAGSEMLAFGGIISDVYSGAESLGGPSAAEWGLIGAILLKGPTGLGGLLSGLVLLNSGLKEFDLNIGNLWDSATGSSAAVQNLLDVFSGKRSWDTGEFLGDFTDLDKVIADEFAQIDNPKIDVDLNTDAAKTKLEEINNLQKQSAAAWLTENEKATEKMVSNMASSIEKMNQDILDSTKDFAGELRDLQREGMSDEDSWNDLNSQIDEYKQKAAEAAKAGNWKEQGDYIARIKELITSMPDSVTETVTADDVARAKQIYEYQLKITRGGQNAYGDAAQPFIDAKKEYESLLKAQQEGSRTIVSEEEVRKAKIQEIQSINEAILENKKNQVTATEDEKAALEKSLSNYKEMATGATDANGELTSSVDDVGAAWEEVGGTWQRISADIISNTSNIAAELDKAITKMNTLNSSSSSSSSSNYGGARALGGPVTAGKDYMVGERGIEMFTPSVSGYITPNNKLNAGGGKERMVDVNLSIGGGSAIPFKASQTSIDDLNRQMEDQRRYAG